MCRIAANRFWLVLTALVLASGNRTTSAQSIDTRITGLPSRAPRATLAECTERLGATDSVQYYFNAYYELTPKACAAIRRHARLNAEGLMEGTVRDYQISSNRLLARADYHDGALQGPVEAYYPSGQLLLRGLFERNQRRGEWTYWYPSGQPWQVFRYPADGVPRVISCWDTTGQVLVANGQGRWQGWASAGNWRSAGNVRLGLPDGPWRGWRDNYPDRSVTENYEAGTFRDGTWTEIIGQTRKSHHYLYDPQLQPLTYHYIEAAWELQPGYTCEVQNGRKQSALLKQKLQVPAVAVGTGRYAELLSQRLYAYSTTQWYRQLPATVKIIATLNQAGQFTSFEGGYPVLNQLVQELMQKELPQWNPALYEGAGMPGNVAISLNTTTRTAAVWGYVKLKTELIPVLPTADLTWRQ